MALYKIGVVHISTPKDLMTAGEALYDPRFRGQGSDKWGLESTLERDARIFGVPRDGLWRLEKNMLDIFKKRAHIYIRDFETPKNDFEWFSLIRHYGGPSRLLDVTTSYLVAAYFALCDSQPKRDAAIWAFRPSSEMAPVDIDKLFKKDSTPALEVVSPDRLNDRLHSQSGEFFVPGSVAESLEDQVGRAFETNLKEKPISYRSVNRMEETKLDHSIWKFIIPRSKHSEMFRFISRCNVRAYSLFPGIDGLALSLREMMRVLD